MDRLLRPARVQHLKKGLSATRPGTLPQQAVPTRGGPPDTSRPGSVEADTVAHCDDSTEGDHVHSLTLTELDSGWTENRAVWNKSADAVLVQLKALERVVPFTMKDFLTDNGGEFLNWAPHRHLTGFQPSESTVETKKTNGFLLAFRVFGRAALLRRPNLRLRASAALPDPVATVLRLV